MTIKIIGAGMAGLLAANLLKHHNPIVIERGDSLPNNHSAILRFRSSIIGDLLGIDFKKVRMIKAPLPWKNPVADALSYSFKNSGMMRSDRSITDGMVSADRWIAPSNLIEQMAEGIEIRYGEEFDFASSGEKVISTIPMPFLMKALSYSRQIKFDYSSGVNIKARIENCDAYVSLLVPDPDEVFSRVSVTGDELIVEIPGTVTMEKSGDEVPPVFQPILYNALRLLGIQRSAVKDVSVHNQRYQKILPIDNDDRREFIHWASATIGKAYQLGRFATWRPGLLLDDLVKDIRIIDGWIKSKSSIYDQYMIHSRRA